MSSASALARRRRPRRHARPRPAPAPAPGPASPSASPDQEWLWCDNHDKISQWFLTKPHIKFEEFYASFINFANRAWELSRCQDRAPLEGLQKFVVELLQKERIPADELLTALQDYLVGQGDGKARWKEIGLVPFALGLGKSLFSSVCVLPTSSFDDPYVSSQPHLTTLSHGFGTVVSYENARSCTGSNSCPQRYVPVTFLYGH